MKAKLEFDLTDIDDRMEHLRAIKSLDMALTLWDIQFNLKRRCENIIESSDNKMDSYEVLELVFNEIYKSFEEHDINTDKLVN
jgi:hypothetical protein